MTLPDPHAAALRTRRDALVAACWREAQRTDDPVRRETLHALRDEIEGAGLGLIRRHAARLAAWIEDPVGMGDD